MQPLRKIHWSKQSHNFPHATTAELSWHVQNCALTGSLESKLEQIESSWDFNCEVIIPSWIADANGVVAGLSQSTPWWRHQMETFSALLAFCVGNSRWIPHTKASDAELYVFFDLRLNKPVRKQSWGWWFETPARSLWRHCNDRLLREMNPRDPTEPDGNQVVWSRCHTEAWTK